MTPERRARLEAAGHVVTTPAEWLGLDEADQRVNDFRLRLSREVMRLRGVNKLSQRELATILKIGQSRITAIERGGASIEAIAGALLVLGGTLEFPLTNAPSRITNSIANRRRSPRSTGPINLPPLMARRKIATNGQGTTHH